MSHDLFSELRANWFRWLPIGAEIGLALLVGVLILFVEVKGPLVASILIGFLFAQMLIAAVWASLAPFGFFFRFTSGTLFMLFLCLCMFCCAHRDGGGMEIALPIAGAMVIQWCLYQIPLYSLTRSGWKLARLDAPYDHPREEFQFGIRHLLIWTTCVAVFLGIVRAFVPLLEITSTDLSDTIHFGLHLALGNTLIALPVIWGCLSRFYFWPWMLVAAATCGLVSVSQAMIARDTMEFDFLLSVNISQTIVSIVAMLAFRRNGYRLHRPSSDSQVS